MVFVITERRPPQHGLVFNKGRRAINQQHLHGKHSEELMCRNLGVESGLSQKHDECVLCCAENKLSSRLLFLQEAERTLCQLSSVCFCFITAYKTLVNQRPNTRLHPQSTQTRPAGRLQTELVRKYNTVKIKCSSVFYNFILVQDRDQGL